jgi:hypothetical protein
VILNLLRLILAVAWTLAWGAVRWLKYLRSYPGWPRRVQLAFRWGRRESPKAVRCQECGWTGPLRWAIHSYEASGDDDVEPVDRCPSCDADALWPALWRGKGGWAS